MLSVTASLSSGGLTSDADWWLVGRSPFGWYYYSLAKHWLPGFHYTYQGPLFDAPQREVLHQSGLPAGSYTFFFAVDLLMNGMLDLQQAQYDSVRITIVP